MENSSKNLHKYNLVNFLLSLSASAIAFALSTPNQFQAKINYCELGKYFLKKQGQKINFVINFTQV